MQVSGLPSISLMCLNMGLSDSKCSLLQFFANGKQHQINNEGLAWKMLDIVALLWPPLHPTMSNNAQQDAQQCWDLLSEMLYWFGRGFRYLMYPNKLLMFVLIIHA